MNPIAQKDALRWALQRPYVEGVVETAPLLLLKPHPHWRQFVVVPGDNCGRGLKKSGLLWLVHTGDNCRGDNVASGGRDFNGEKSKFLFTITSIHVFSQPVWWKSVNGN